MMFKVLEQVRGTVPYGTTPEGVNWVSKTLHPAGESTIAGIPDGFNRPTAKYSVMSTAVIHSPTGSSMEDTWDSDMVFFHNPLLLAYMHNVNGPILSYESNLVNPALYTTFPTTIQDYHAGLVQFANMTERYRPLYYSVTVTPICSALTNQGTVVVAQYPSVPRMTTVDGDALMMQDLKFKGACTSKKESTPAPSSSAPVRQSFHSQREANMAAALIVRRIKDPVPNYEGHNLLVRSLVESYTNMYSDVNALTVLPNTYVGAFKDGVYSVMKLSSGFEHWQSTRNVRHYSSVADSVEFVTDPFCLSRLVYHQAATAGYPYPLILGLDEFSANAAVLPRSEDNVIHISFRGMHKDAQFKVTIRVGWEFECLPQSPIAPFVNGPSAPDMSALESYGRIARMIKDGYPEAYNSWERLVDVIEGVADAAGVVFPGAGLVGKGARWIYNLLNRPGKSKAKGKAKEEAAEVDRVRKQMRETEAQIIATRKAAAKMQAELPKLKTNMAARRKARALRKAAKQLTKK